MLGMVCIITTCGALLTLPELYELNIGHAIIGRAVFSGLAPAVEEMKRLMREARR